MNLFALGFGNAPGAADYYAGSPFSVGGGLTVGPVMPPTQYGPAIPSIVEKPLPFSPSDQLSAIPYVMPTYLPSATAPINVVTVEGKSSAQMVKDKWNSLSPGVKIAVGLSGAAIIALVFLKLVKE